MQGDFSSRSHISKRQSLVVPGDWPFRTPHFTASAFTFQVRFDNHTVPRQNAFPKDGVIRYFEQTFLATISLTGRGVMKFP